MPLFVLKRLVRIIYAPHRSIIAPAHRQLHVRFMFGKVGHKQRTSNSQKAYADRHYPGKNNAERKRQQAKPISAS